MGIQDRDVFEPSNETEALAIEALLEDHGIEAAVISFHDTAFDGVYQTQKGWGRIRVRVEDEQRACELISEWRGADVVEDDAEAEVAGVPVQDDRDADDPDAEAEFEPTSTKQKRMQGFVSRVWQTVGPFLLAVSVALNLYLAYRSGPKLDATTQSEYDSEDHLVAKSYYRKGVEGAYLVEEFDNYARLVARYHDKNGDKRFETVSMYSTKGLVIIEERDTDADGRCESRAFFHQRRLVARSVDLDRDGRHDRLVVFHGAQPSATYLDSNRDGRYNSVEYVTRQRGRVAKYTDRDGDGFPEHVSCRGVDGIVTLDTVPCKLTK